MPANMIETLTWTEMQNRRDHKVETDRYKYGVRQDPVRQGSVYELWLRNMHTLQQRERIHDVRG
jgi:hypothetical protein